MHAGVGRPQRGALRAIERALAAHGRRNCDRVPGGGPSPGKPRQHLGIEVVGDELRLEYVVDMAEIPAFTEIRRMVSLDDYAAESCPWLMEGLVVTLDGKLLELDAIGVSASTPPGDAGVPTLRVECRYASSLHLGRSGWRTGTTRIGSDGGEVTVASTSTPITSDLPATSPSEVLTAYPDDGTSLDVGTAAFEVGSGAVVQGEGANGAVPSGLVQMNLPGVGCSSFHPASCFNRCHPTLLK